MEEITKSIYDIFDRFLYKKRNPSVENPNVLTSPNLSVGSSVVDNTVNNINTLPSDVPPVTQEVIDSNYLTLQQVDIDLQNQINNLGPGGSALSLVATLTLISDSIGAGTDSTFNNSIIMGVSAGVSNVGVPIAFDDEILIGSFAGYKPTSGWRSIYIGQQAGTSSQHNYNIGLGYMAGAFVTDVCQNVIMIGYMSGYFSKWLGNSVFIGNNTASNITSGVAHTGIVAIGDYAYSGPKGSSTIHHNSTFIGYLTGRDVYRAEKCTIIGSSSGQRSYLTNTIILGYSSGSDENLGKTSPYNGGSILIGNYLGVGNYFWNDSIVIGHGTATVRQYATKAYQFKIVPYIMYAQFRGIDYEFPSVQGAAGTVLTNDGSGKLTWA